MQRRIGKHEAKQRCAWSDRWRQRYVVLTAKQDDRSFAAFELIRSYSPYDNVEAKAYPPMLITGGLNDPRVTYWEPAKWTAKLRATKTDHNLLLLKINMGAGHGGKSGRYDSLHEDAESYAFILTQTGVQTTAT